MVLKFEINKLWKNLPNARSIRSEIGLWHTKHFSKVFWTKEDINFDTFKGVY